MSDLSSQNPELIVNRPLPTEEQITQGRALSKRGLHLQAWQGLADCADFRTWPAGDSRRVAAMLGSRLGSSRWASVLDWRNWRAIPDSEEYFYYAQFVRLGQGRWWEAVRAVEQKLAEAVSSEVRRADLIALRGWLYGKWRDFDRAFPLLDEAIAINEQRAWLWVEKSSILQVADRREEALDIAEHALRLESNYRPAVLLRSELLQELRRDEESEAFLKECHQASELAAYPVRLHALCSERDEFDPALDYLDEYEALSPLLDKKGKEWLAGRRADLYLDKGDVTRFFAAAEQTGEKSFQKRAAKYLKESEGKPHQRKRLAVPFIRQHSMTCAPATLASLAAFWGKEEDHLQIAEAICYNGTPWHKERDWAREHGFVTREFKVTAESTKALIDRGVPFTLSTAWTTGAHLQACVGYDEFLSSAVIRDPTSRHSIEMTFEGLAEEHPMQGPRGMVMVPEEKKGLLDGLDFPDEAVYDAHHDFGFALQEHRRPDAEAALVRMVEAGGEEHPVLWWCRQRLAGYDSNAAEELVWVDRLIERFPKVERFRYWRLHILQRLSLRDEREKSLRAIIARKRCSTVFYSELGELYAEDDRDYVMAHHFLRKAMRVSPTEEVAYASLAYAKWRRFEREEALELHRLSATLSCRFEPYARDYFDACVALGKRDEGLEFLEKRVASLGQKESGPWLTLVRAFSQLGRTSEAKEKLEEAVASLAKDGELLLEAAERLSYWGEAEGAWGMMVRARGIVGERSWHEAVGRMAGFLGEREKAISAWEEVASLAPTLLPAHRALARYYEESETGAALSYLREVLVKQPEHPTLLGLFAEWCGGEETAEALDALQRGLEILPNWPWAIREVALKLNLLGRPEEAIVEARRAAALSEFDSGSWGILGDILWQREQVEEAEECFKKALSLEVDYGWAANNLMEMMRRRGAVDEGLCFLRQEIERQVSTGEAVFIFREQAYRHREPEELLAELKEFCQQRPDLWQTWSAVKDQGVAMSRMDEAEKAVEELVRRFPLLPRSYTERAEIEHAKGHYEAEIENLQRALELSPSWDFAARRLSEAFERLGRYEEALASLELASQAEPLVAANHGMAARLIAIRGDAGSAFERMKRAVEVDASYEYGWGELIRWAEELDCVAEVKSLVDEMDAGARHREKWWDTKRWILDSLGDGEGALAIAKEAVERFPQNLLLRDQLTVQLCEEGEYEEALRECQRPEDGGHWDRRLAGRHAWIQMEAGFPREAIDATRSLVDKEPDYVWAWRNLMRWNSQRSNWEESLEAARRVNRLDPDDAPAWGFRGEAATKLEKEDEALECLEKAYLLDPEYSYGGRELLEKLVDKKDYERAREIWKSLTHFSPSPYVHVDGLTIELAEGNAERVSVMTEELLAMEIEKGSEVLSYAEWAFEKYKQTTHWDEVLSQKMKREPSRAMVTAWARACMERGHRTKSISRLKKLKVPFESKAGAWCVVLDMLYGGGEGEAASELVRKNWAAFQTDDETWAEGGYTLMHWGKQGEAVKWFGDWRKRGESLTTRDYLNLTTSAIREGDYSLAREVVQTGLYRFRQGEFAESLRSVRRFLDEVEDQGEDADGMAALAEATEGLPFYRKVDLLSDAMQSARRGDFGGAEATFREVGQEWKDWLDDPVYDAYLKGAAQTLARRLPKYRNKAKKLMKSLQPRRTSPLAALGSERAIFVGFAALYIIYRIFRALGS